MLQHGIQQAVHVALSCAFSITQRVSPSQQVGTVGIVGTSPTLVVAGIADVVIIRCHKLLQNALVRVVRLDYRQP